MVQLFTSTLHDWQNICWLVAYAMATSLTGAAAACASRVYWKHSECARLLAGLPSRCTFYGVMWLDATDILVRRVELHHPGVDDARRQAVPQRAKVRSHPRTARLPALDPCHVHVLTAAHAPRARAGKREGINSRGIFFSGVAWRNRRRPDRRDATRAAARGAAGRRCDGRWRSRLLTA